MSKRKRRSLAYFWTTRYFAIIFISMIVIGTILVTSVQQITTARQQAGLTNIVRDLAAEASGNGGVLPDGLDLVEWLDELAVRYVIYGSPMLVRLDRTGQIVQQYPVRLPVEESQLAAYWPQIDNGQSQIFTLKNESSKETLYMGTSPIIVKSETVGYMLYFMHKQNVIADVLEHHPPRFIFITSLWLSSILIIYMLTRRLLKPIREVADAAKQVVAGNYNLQISKDYQEKEIDELMHSFKEMADRLNRLELLRTQLLASVTHDLKTPLTSIGGLIQAVKDGVVTGEEADEFLAASLKEASVMQKIVEDLLDFNSFASGTLKVANEKIDLQAVVSTAAEHWRLGQQPEFPEIQIELADETEQWETRSDAIRIEQIITNLLNNARDALNKDDWQAMALAGKQDTQPDQEQPITLRLFTEQDYFMIQVEDRGRGLSPLDQQDIFEPFYRGSEKKTRIRGLGIGLPFSRLIARSLGGDLVLSSTRPGKTIFTLSLPIN